VQVDRLEDVLAEGHPRLVERVRHARDGAVRSNLHLLRDGRILDVAAGIDVGRIRYDGFLARHARRCRSHHRRSSRGWSRTPERRCHRPSSRRCGRCCRRSSAGRVYGDNSVAYAGPRRSHSSVLWLFAADELLTQPTNC